MRYQISGRAHDVASHKRQGGHLASVPAKPEKLVPAKPETLQRHAFKYCRVQQRRCGVIPFSLLLRAAETLHSDGEVHRASTRSVLLRLSWSTLHQLRLTLILCLSSTSQQLSVTLLLRPWWSISHQLSLTPAPVSEHIAPLSAVNAAPAPVFFTLAPAEFVAPGPVHEHLVPVPTVDAVVVTTPAGGAASAPVDEYITTMPAAHAVQSKSRQAHRVSWCSCACGGVHCAFSRWVRSLSPSCGGHHSISRSVVRYSCARGGVHGASASVVCSTCTSC